MAEDKVNVAIIGLGFGTQFIPIYKRHRQANMHAICRRSETELFEWPLIEGEDPVLHTAKKPQAETAQRVKVPDYAHLLPEEIRPFTTKTFLDLEEYQHLANKEADPDGTHSHLITDPGSLEGHGGSHPHLAHEFVSALVEDRDPFPNAVQSANYTCVGILAHESAMQGGERIALPEFTFLPKRPACVSVTQLGQGVPHRQPRICSSALLRTSGACSTGLTRIN